MHFHGFIEVLMMAILSGGAGSTDLVALIHPQHYFQVKEIGISPARAVELAHTEPKTAKAQVMQLTALRYLYEETEALKKSPRYDGHRKAIEEIAQGKAAQDPLGFAKDYAQRVLDRLDGNPPEKLKLPPVREDALTWFPAHVKLAGAIDFRQARGPGFGSDPLKELLKVIPDGEKRRMYTYIEQAGNIRIDRIAFGFTEDEKNRDQHKIYVRFTGKANTEWALGALKNLNQRMQSREVKDESGATITVLQEANNPPVLAILGNTDVVMVGYGGNRGKHEDLLDEVLAVRAKKQPNATAGALKDRLAKVPDKAVALLVGDAPSDMKRELGFMFNPAPVPTSITAFIERAQQGLDLQVETNMANKNESDQIVQKIGQLRKDGIQELRREMGQPQPPEFPPIPFQQLINLMESLQVQNDQARVQVRLLVPDGLMQQLGAMGGMMFGSRAFDAPLPPPKDK